MIDKLTPYFKKKTIKNLLILVLAFSVYSLNNKLERVQEDKIRDKEKSHLSNKRLQDSLRDMSHEKRLVEIKERELALELKKQVLDDMSKSIKSEKAQLRQREEKLEIAALAEKVASYGFTRKPLSYGIIGIDDNEKKEYDEMQSLLKVFIVRVKQADQYDEWKDFIQERLPA